MYGKVMPHGPHLLLILYIWIGVMLALLIILQLLTHGLLNQSMVTLTSPLLIWTNMLI